MIVEIVNMPMPLDGMTAWTKTMQRKHGPDLAITALRGHAYVLLAGSTPEAHCWCRSCDAEVRDQYAAAGGNPFDLMVTMTVCVACGDKRCPRADSHDVACAAGLPDRPLGD